MPVRPRHPLPSPKALAQRARRLPRAAGAALLFAASALAHAADAPSLLLPDDAGLRDDLEWLVDRGVLSLPLGTWPLPSMLLEAALGQRPRTLPDAADADALARVRRALDHSRDPAHAALRLNSARHPALDDRGIARGSADARIGVRAAGAADWSLRLELGGTAEALARGASQPTLAGSYAMLRLSDAVFALGQVDRWWGPGRYASPILSNAAPPQPALLVRRAIDTAPDAPALRWIGPWGYELSFGELLEFHPAHTKLLGMRLYARPWPNVELGVSRSMQWAGAGRPASWPALRDALLGHSNIDDPAQRGMDPSNELAGFDARVAGALGNAASWAGYAHLVGEDEAGGLPSAWIGTIGAALKYAAGGQRWAWRLESSDTVMSRLWLLNPRSERHPEPRPAYTHHIYADGYYAQGLPLGAAIGGGGRIATAGLALAPIGDPLLRRYSLALWSGRVSQTGAQAIDAAFGTPGRLDGFALAVQGETARALRWNVGLSVQRYSAGVRPTAGVQAGIDVPLR